MHSGSMWNGAAKRMVFAAGCVVAASHAVFVAATLVDFENLPAGTTVTTQYAAQGVVFGSAYLATDPNARSGTRVLRTVSPTAEVFTPIPLRMTFSQPQARVKLYATSPGVARNGTLTAFDAAGAVIATDGPKLVAADRFTTMFEVTAKQAGIARAELQLESASHYAIDDLEFDSSVAPPVRVIETRQPSARENAAVIGRFPTEWSIGPPPEPAAVQPGTGEAEERFDIAISPAVERELAPGASAEVRAPVTARAGVAGSVRWIGTAAELPVTLSLTGSPDASGQPYALGVNRGGSDVGGVAQSAGEARLSVKNTSAVRVKVRLSIGVVRGQGL